MFGLSGTALLRYRRTLVRLLEQDMREEERLVRTARVICGARCRDGHACKRKSVPGKKRCPNHGGLSTGPRTPEGRARVAAAIAERNRQRVRHTRPFRESAIR